MTAALLVPIIVTDAILEPSGAGSPTGRVQFQLTEEITGPEQCAAKLVEADYVGGVLAQQLYANDFDNTGSPISPSTTMYYVAQDVDGAAAQTFFITVPATPPGSRSVEDAVVEQGSALLTSATAAFTSDDVGKFVLVGNGSVFSPGTQILGITSSTVAQLDRSASSSGTGVSLMIGASASLSELRPAE